MRTWNDYKDHVKKVDPETGKDMEEAEEMAAIISAMIEQRQALGLSQRELAHRCGMPQSSIARIESCAAMPKIGTISNMFRVP
ncbi:helix-turn-helix domain-containing protein [uncultured Dubosiella sp.]|uniref:helix-turn-helix domain-containing protein n=1 Tax=uncultured Dubosiella sp. TaxID=1937011 RepID=UPI0025DA91C9|nr:helix-turn-helix transcriptional regulator [uncultured Dubosiella sp.]